MFAQKQEQNKVINGLSMLFAKTGKHIDNTDDIVMTITNEYNTKAMSPSYGLHNIFQSKPKIP